MKKKDLIWKDNPDQTGWYFWRKNEEVGNLVWFVPIYIYIPVWWDLEDEIVAQICTSTKDSPEAMKRIAMPREGQWALIALSPPDPYPRKVGTFVH